MSESDEEEPPTKKSKISSTLPVCPYGAKCYRKNPQHFKEYSHPGTSSKHDSSPPLKSSKSADESVKLPPCKYGASCYRKNLLHFAEFSHPTSSSTSVPEDSGSDTDVINSDDEKVF